MFELIEDRKKPEIRWWTMPAAVFMIFLLGANIGILVGRRKWHFDDWLQVILLFVGTCIVTWPILREINHRIGEKDVHGD